MSTSRTTLTVADGRRLDLAVSGPDDGPVLVFHHGTPGSADPMRTVSGPCDGRGLRVVTWSRPGYAGSTRLPGRDVAHAAEDLVAVLDHLGVGEAWVGGWSGGGPHALACAAGAPDRVTGVFVVAGVAPYDAPGLDWSAGMGEDNQEEFAATVAGEAALRDYLDAVAPGLAGVTPDQIVGELSSLLPPVDVAVLSGDDGLAFAEDLARNCRTALATGIDGWVDDDLSFARPWGFDLAGVGPVHVWQGTEDLMVPFAHGEWLAANLPDAVPHLLAGDGHVSLVTRMGVMLDELLRTPRR
ncbi:MAG: alpha/beta hydrolase [Nocardioidaceae bacterium]